MTYTIETLVGSLRGLSLARASDYYRERAARGGLVMVSRDSDGVTIAGCNGFYVPPYVELTPTAEERAAFTTETT